ncbi:MAG: DNA primase [Vampirovibrionia bacterium]
MNNFNAAIEEIRARTDIVEVISEYVALKKAGRNWTGLCPFHNEKTPSFMVNREKNIFKCFGCGAGGDALSFLQQIQKKSFSEIVADLAEKYGIKINYSNQNIELKTQILELNKLAAKYFTDNLFNSETGKHAKTYLNDRGISDETIFQFNLGYAPNGWDNIINLLLGSNISKELMVQAGLATKKESTDRYYDRFRDRIIIPIHNERGQIIAFGGRSLTEENTPKYLNSPETPIFFKGKNIYSLYQAKEAIQKEDSVILVEGYFDAITAHANGITNVVATLGTALTSDQLRLLGKYTESKRIFIAFDADLAGGSATDRGIEVIKNTFGGLGGVKILDNKYSKNSVYEIRIISIPNGKDPDEFIRKKGPEAFQRLIKNAPLLLDFQIDQILCANDINTVNGKVNATRQLAEILAEINSPLIRSEYIRIAADRISVQEEDLLKELNQLKPASSNSRLSKIDSLPQISNKKTPEDFILAAERNLISLYFLNQDHWDLIQSGLEEVTFLNENHMVIKSILDELITKCNSIDEVTQAILANLIENKEAMEILSDIIFNLEDKQCLKEEKQIQLFIKENLACITRFKAQHQQKELKEEYRNAEDDEIKALELQYQVRQIVNSRLSAV